MKPVFITLAVWLLGIQLVNAQSQPSSLQMQAPPPPAAVPYGNVAGVPGQTAYTYYVVVNYPAGSVVSAPVLVRNAPNTLTGSNYVNLGWQPLAGATSYDVVRTTPPATFNGSCPSCALVTGLTSPGTTDTGGSLTAYTATTPAVGSGASFYINTRDYNPPQLRQVINGTDAPVFWGTPIGNFVPPSTVTTVASGYLNGTGTTDMVCNPLNSGVEMQVAPIWTATGSSGTTVLSSQFKSGSVYYTDVLAGGSLTAGGAIAQAVTNAPLILDGGECQAVNVSSYGVQVFWTTTILTYPVSNNGPHQIKSLGYADATPIVLFTATGSGAYILPASLTFTNGISNTGSLQGFDIAAESTTLLIYIVPPGGSPDGTNLLGISISNNRTAVTMPLFLAPGYTVQIKHTSPASSTTAWAMLAVVGLP